ncbi:hypothetical protein BJ684DRAFT_15058 [Piptocephalis cylindrospora]|uniref:Uncharacterized protein n=1 Tax=Piptocephalis cylindrospora TaxID=1907219 RepID=A0A4P9Y735_9FUNG|nr:hypothetical protein BJ684DRAFT_15058 [Piptocephalis cylindrospora]|eukprot:RKP14632.1 hypothetical protein BJ684DRAFT_15058 [Piptocephalis cylindrospora]
MPEEKQAFTPSVPKGKGAEREVHSASPAPVRKGKSGVYASTSTPSYPHSVAHLGLVGFAKDSAHTLSNYVRERRRSWDGGGRVDDLSSTRQGEIIPSSSPVGPIRPKKRQNRMDEAESRLLNRKGRKIQNRTRDDESGEEAEHNFPRIAFDQDYLRAREAMLTHRRGSHPFTLFGHPMGSGDELEGNGEDKILRNWKGEGAKEEK